MVRQARSGARGVKAVVDELVRLQAFRDRVDGLALALDDGERDALGVVRDEVLADAARVVSAVVQFRLLGVQTCLYKALTAGGEKPPPNDSWRQSSNSLRLTRIASS